MSTAVSWVLQLSVRDGKLEAGKALMNEMVPATQAEPGTTDYAWYLSPDESTIHIYERYSDSDAVMAHLGNFGAKFAERFMACFEPTGLHVYGNVSHDAEHALGELGGQFLKPLGGFNR